MIFYFTGTGNSLHAARVIAGSAGDVIISIADEIRRCKNVFEYVIQDGDRLGIIYPVYAWGPPKIVLDFINGLKVMGGRPYVFTVGTCGEEEGISTRIMRKALTKVGLEPDSAFSIAMPSNYMVGFNLEAAEVREAKLAAADKRLAEISAAIANRRRGMTEIVPGRFPRLKYGMINPLFNRFALNTKHFNVTDSCTGCGMCAEICPVRSIKLASGKPVWDRPCTQCFGCINRCPAEAIQYGRSTVGKGRYVHPDLLLNKYAAEDKSLDKNLIDRILKFRDDRNWKQFHNPKDLAISISLEAAELLENFQWTGPNTTAEKNREGISEELADVFIYSVLMADAMGLNIDDIISGKLTKNEMKYRVDKAYGSSKKYTELE